MRKLWTPQDGSIDLVEIDGEKYIHVHSKLGYPALYPLHDVSIEAPTDAVLMDLDGTSVKSEEFWMWVIGQTVAELIDHPKFELSQADIPHVSGHSVSEHLQYCIDKYCPDKTVEEARGIYSRITDVQMQAILEGHGRSGAFTPAEGLRDFLLTLKSKGVKIGLVTSGLYKKAMPEIISAFRTLGMGDPADFYDCIITAGFPLGKGCVGTLGELSPKPHPWLYAETMRVGLGIPFERRAHVIGIEDSSAGVVSIRLAGVAPLGLTDGNIIQAGMQSMCYKMINSLEEAHKYIKGKEQK